MDKTQKKTEKNRKKQKTQKKHTVFSVFTKIENGFCILIPSMKYIKWNKWTCKSKHIPFKSNNTGIGDGEKKTAAELETIVLGQNSNHDMNIVLNNVVVECDVKKLDSYTFNTGVKGRNAVRPIKHLITDLLRIFKNISKSSLLSSEEKAMLIALEEISPDEICVSKLEKIQDACFMLHIKYALFHNYLPIVFMFEDTPNPLALRLDKYYSMCLILQKPLPSEAAQYTDILVFITEITHKYVLYPYTFKEDISGLVSIFKDVTLIFVDEKQGYCIWDNISSITFERITRGNPRFRLCL